MKEKNKDTTKSCCENKKEHECCHKAMKEIEHECCHKENKESKHECCHKAMKESEHECCHKAMKESEHECCHKAMKESEHECCHKAMKENEHECCHKNTTKEQNCCHEKENSNMGSCCAVSSGSCCSTSTKNISNEIKKKVIFLSVSLVALILSYINFWKLVGLEQIDFLDFGYIAVILCGYSIYVNAFLALKKKKITSQLLVSIAITASIILEIVCRTTSIEMHTHHSYVFVAGEVAFLMTLGGLIESWTLKASRKGIERIVNMSPKTANVKVDDEIKTIKINDIKIGDIVLVKPNEMIPVDGVVVNGNSAVDQSSVTGEFIPVDVKKGSVVYGATWNKMGVLEIKVTKESQDMTVNKLIHLALEAEEKKAPISRVVDKFASWIVPSVVIFSILVGVLSKFAFGLNWIQSLIRSVTILIVFCPCSLALATPTALAAGIGSGAYHGIIIKSGEALETLAKINAIAFDKTGTLTVGDIQVKEIIPFSIEKDKLLQLVASAEKYSEHPIGKAIIKYAKGKVKLIEPKNTCSQVGVGIKAEVDGDEINVISFKQAEKEYKKDENLKGLKKYLEKGYTVLVVVKNNEIVGSLCLYDTIREDTFETMQKIKELNIETMMLTGDNINSAKNIAQTCDIATIKASLMPEDKLKVINEAQNDGKKICMVGDGVNDAPALATADCSIAMSAMGNDVAVETADVAIMNSDIKNVYNAINLAKKTLNTVKRNIAISMCINVISLTLSILGILNPVTGAIVHTCSSVFVVLSSAFVLKTKYFEKNKNKEKTSK